MDKLGGRRIHDQYLSAAVNYSVGFAFHDADGFINSVYMLYWTGRKEYMRKEIDIMSVVQPHLENLDQNLFVLASTRMMLRDSSVQRR